MKIGDLVQIKEECRARDNGEYIGIVMCNSDVETGDGEALFQIRLFEDQIIVYASPDQVNILS